MGNKHNTSGVRIMERFMYVAQDLNKWAPAPLWLNENKHIQISDQDILPNNYTHVKIRYTEKRSLDKIHSITTQNTMIMAIFCIMFLQTSPPLPTTTISTGSIHLS